MSGINLRTQTPVSGLSPQFKAENEMQQIADKVGNRSLGGRICSWVRNKAGVASQSTATFRQALKTRVGTNSVADDILNKAGLTNGKPLSSRKAKEALRLTSEFLDKQQQSSADLNSKVTKVVRNALHVSNASQAPSTLTNNSAAPTPPLPTTATAQKKVDLASVQPLPVLSPSGQALHNAIKERLDTGTTGMTKA